MTSKRKVISKKIRFEVFKRDSFKCQYCGKCAPDVILHIDHINPISKGGDNDILNLITACEDCNGGKSDRLLSDDSVMAKQRAQLEELNERREQLEQMLAWRDGLRSLDDVAVDAVVEAWNNVIPGYSLNATGITGVRKMIHKFGVDPVLAAIPVCLQYLKYDESGKLTQESAGVAFAKWGGVIRMSSQPEWKREIYYVRGIVRNRYSYVNESYCLRLLERAYELGAGIDTLKSIATSERNWTGWQSEMHALIDSLGGA